MAFSREINPSVMSVLAIGLQHAASFSHGAVSTEPRKIETSQDINYF